MHRCVSPRIVRVVTPDGGLDVRDVQPAVLRVGNGAVRDAHEGRSPAPFVLKDVGLVSEDDLVSSPAVTAHGDEVPHRAAVFLLFGVCGCFRAAWSALALRLGQSLLFLFTRSERGRRRARAGDAYVR